MQPLVSPVDHESRHNSYRADDYRESTVSEDTPLLRRFPNPEASAHTKLIVFLLIFVLLSGVIIGIYLLVIQINSENILPPINTPLEMISRSQWDSGGRRLLGSPAARASEVAVVQTDSEQCHHYRSCAALLKTMQANATATYGDLPYNFLVSSGGQTFEGLGWQTASPLYPEHPHALVLAFIGNFTHVSPTQAQVTEAKNLFSESISLQHLEPSFILFGKRTKETPTLLFESFKRMPQWREALTDV